MNEKEMRAQLAALEEQNASLKEQKAMRDKIAALEAENAALDSDLKSDAVPSEAGDATAVTEAGGATAVTSVTNAETAGEAAGSPDVTTTVVARRHSRVRGALVGFLVFLTCLTLIVTGVTVWTHYTVLNADGYMKLVGPVGKDPQAIKALSDYVTTQVVTATDLQGRAQSALPPRAQFLAGPITSAVQSFVNKQTVKVLSTPQAYNLWLGVNRVAHQQIVGLLRGQNNYTYIQGNDVKLNTLPLVSQALQWLSGKLPGGLSSKFPPAIVPGTPASTSIQEISLWAGKPLPADFGQITLLKNDALGPAKNAVRLFDGLVIALPIILAVLILVTILLSQRRRRTIMALGIGGAIALIVTYVIIKRASAAVVSGLHLGSVTEVVRSVVTASLGPLATITIWIVTIGAIVAVAAWLYGRKDVQTVIVNTGKKVVVAQGAALGSSSRPVRWIDRHIQLLRVAGLVAGLILLVIAAASSWLGITFAILLALLYQGVLSLLVNQWPFGRRAAGADAGSPAG